VIVLCEVPHLLDGEEVRNNAMASFGDSARVLPMLAQEFGAEQARHADRIASLMARAGKRK
jgi:hypothetical protein